MSVVIGLGRWLLHAAVEAIAPVIGGCAAALVGNQCGNTRLGKVVGGGVESAVDYFGKLIVEQWLGESNSRSAEEQQCALAELASMPPAEVRRESEELLANLHLSFLDVDKQVALDYLCAIPQTLSRTLRRAAASRRATLLTDSPVDDAALLLSLLPIDVPPYAAPCDLPGTTYRLEALIGEGGFGNVYRAVDPRMPYLPLAIKFCRDRSALPVLQRERDNLEHLIQAGSTAWSPRVVRLCGYNLDHPTPYLIYEYISGGDLASTLAERIDPPAPDEVLRWVRGITEGLAFAHQHGLVHRDLKPSNVLLAPDGVKLADFGIGGTARLPAQQLSGPVSLMRGAGTPLYMSPEQKRGEAPDPRHDLYSLGVIWYQLLIGDLSRELHPGWEEELREEARAPETQIELIHRCVGVARKRPAHAGELLSLLNDPQTTADDGTVPQQLIKMMWKLRDTHDEKERESRPTTGAQLAAILLAIGAFLLGLTVIAGTGEAILFSMVGMRSNAINVWMPIISILALVGSGWFAVRARKRFLLRSISRRTEPYRRAIALQVDVLVNVFPEAVKEWGGRDILLQRENVERITRELEARSAVAPDDRHRTFRLSPSAHAQTQRPNQPEQKTLPGDQAAPKTAPANLGGEMLRELARQYIESHEAVEEARKTPKRIATLAAVIGYYTFGILGGLIIALPVLFVVFNGQAIHRAIFIPIIAVVGAAITGWCTFLVCRWFLRYQMRGRLQQPLSALEQRVDFLVRAFPEATTELGGREALMRHGAAREMAERLMLLM
jgi:serine/threonine-protein kinase